MINVLPRVHLCIGKINIDELVDMHISNSLMENGGKNNITWRLNLERI